MFTYRTPSDTINGLPAQGVDLHMLATNAEWRWNQQNGAYFRSNSGVPHKDQAGDQVATNNVVVLFVDYKPSPADARSPEAQTTGTGDVWVFTGGQVVGGRWSRPTASDPWTFTDAAGKPDQAHPRPYVGRAGPHRRRRHRQVGGPRGGGRATSRASAHFLPWTAKVGTRRSGASPVGSTR